MVRLKGVFEKLGFSNVRTYINSGNVLFDTSKQSLTQLADSVEKVIHVEFGFEVRVVIRDFADLIKLEKSIPATWVNDATMKTDIMFLSESHDKKEILDQLTIKTDIDDVVYYPGTIVWRVDKQNVTRSGLMKLVGTDLYKHMTIRNVNTLRKLVSMLG